MIKLACEIPTSRIKEWSPLVDLDFILAHKVLDDPNYAKLFKERSKDRKVILDNSTHEFGRPLPFEDLRRAADLCKADVVIAPDIVNPNIDYKQYIQNMEWIYQAGKHLHGYYIGAVMCGKGPIQRETWLERASKVADMLCFSFHMPQRLEWWKHFADTVYVRRFSNVHILGMISITELRRWVKISEKYPEIEFSFDTCKPLKLGVQSLEFSQYEDTNLRGGSINSKSILEMKSFSEVQEMCIRRNISYLQAVCRGEV